MAYPAPTVDSSVGVVPFLYVAYYIPLSVNYTLFRREKYMAVAWVVLIVTMLHFLVGLFEACKSQSLEALHSRYKKSMQVGLTNALSDLTIFISMSCALGIIAEQDSSVETQVTVAEIASSLALIGNAGCLLGRLISAKTITAK